MERPAPHCAFDRLCSLVVDNPDVFRGKLAAPASLLRAWSRAEDRRCIEGNPAPWRAADPTGWAPHD